MNHAHLQKQSGFHISGRNKKMLFCVLVGFFLAIGIFARIYDFGIIPGGVNQDEAFAGYDAYSLLNYGTDSFGYHNPVYLTSWGSGMNVLNTYLMMPFIAILGLTTTAIRMPQVIVACASLFVIFKLMSKMFDRNIGLVALVITAVCPWHIMLSRWGLESNLAPGFILFGFYFFVLGLEKTHWFIVSAVFYGLSLYAYATIWPILPFIIILQFVYCLMYKKLKLISVKTISFVAILAVFAIPLMLFLLVNMGYINEITTPFISIPKLVQMRGGEISLDGIGDKLANLFGILINQTDGEFWNATEEYGIFYHFAGVFAAIGFVTSVISVVMSFIKKEFNYRMFILISFLCTFAMGCLIMVNITRVNSLFLPMLMLIALGICDSVQLIGFAFGKLNHNAGKVAKSVCTVAIAVLYIVNFVGFENMYNTSYKSTINTVFNSGINEAVDFANEVRSNRTIYTKIYYPVILFCAETSVLEYRSTVQFTNYPCTFLDVSTYSHYSTEFEAYDYDDTTKVFVVPSNQIDASTISKNKIIKTFDNISVIY